MQRARAAQSNLEKNSVHDLRRLRLTLVGMALRSGASRSLTSDTAWASVGSLGLDATAVIRSAYLRPTVHKFLSP